MANLPTPGQVREAMESIRRIQWDFFHIGNPLKLSEARRQECVNALKTSAEVLTAYADGSIGPCMSRQEIKKVIKESEAWSWLTGEEEGYDEGMKLLDDLSRALAGKVSKPVEVSKEALDKILPHDDIKEELSALYDIPATEEARKVFMYAVDVCKKALAGHIKKPEVEK